MCQSSFKDRIILKYEDDSKNVSLLQPNENSHGPIVKHLVKWCEKSFLQLNVSKTKDVVIDFRKFFRKLAHTRIHIYQRSNCWMCAVLGIPWDYCWLQTDLWSKQWSFVQKGAPAFVLLKLKIEFSYWQNHADTVVMLLLSLFYHFLWCHGLVTCLWRIETDRVRLWNGPVGWLMSHRGA